MALPLERFLMVYCFPVQLLIGLAGNGLNLVVLTNRRMRSKTNWLLAMLAAADSLFLLTFLPHSLLFNHSALRHPPFRHFLLHANIHITAFVNACAFASAWFVVAVSMERMMAIQWPLHARRLWSCANLRRLVFTIWAFAFAASGYSHFTHSVRWMSRNETSMDPQNGQMHVEKRLALQSAIRPGWENAWAWLTALSALVGVILPVLLVLIANLSILKALGRKKHQRNNKNRDGHFRHWPINSSMPTPSASPQLLPRPSSAQRRHQRRATLAVLVIACTFTLCQTPSALIHLLEVCWPSVGQLHAFRTAAVLSNFLVVTCKTANHFLLCLWSAHFRKNVRLILRQLFYHFTRPNCFQHFSTGSSKKSPRQASTLERQNRGRGHCSEDGGSKMMNGGERLARNASMPNVVNPRRGPTVKRKEMNNCCPQMI